MQFYFAPMEGVTGHVYRNVYASLYQNIDKYFTPFITPNQNQAMRKRERFDILPEQNQGRNTVVQVLTNQASLFLRAWEEVKQLGYKEINLNLGCPSPTVVTKKKGAGFLQDPEQLDRFFDEVFTNCDALISVKTRIGMEQDWEWEELMEVFNRYPIKELIVHPRLQKDYYNGTPDLEAFRYALTNSRAPVCYNGDIFSVQDYKQLTARFPELDRIMLGRGIIANPSLIAEIKGEGMRSKELFRRYHDLLYAAYTKELSGPRDVLFKMKEIWFYFGKLFENGEKPLKKIKKAVRAAEYETAVNRLFSECEIKKMGEQYRF